MTKPLGIYLHIPFCAKKCAYCNFYSAVFTEELCKKYLKALYREIKIWGGRTDRPIDSLYIGGGTPSLIGNGITELLDTVRQSFNFLSEAEITVEVNPDSATQDFLRSAKSCGVNRLSVGVQSGNDDMLKVLGRTHTANDVLKTFETVRSAGFDNISADLMICLPNSNLKSLENDIDFINALSPQHISAYILKVEPFTKLYYSDMPMMDDDKAAEQYLYTCKRLKQKGYRQYEISNFAKDGYQSRHNLKYWNCEEYIGIGPSAHSFFDGERFYYSQDLKGFIASPEIVSDGAGGDCDERIMLGLRLSKGIELLEFTNNINEELKNFLTALKREKMIILDKTHISLTPVGMAVSNQIITEITELLYENL